MENFVPSFRFQTEHSVQRERLYIIFIPEVPRGKAD